MCQTHRKSEGPLTSRLSGIRHARHASGRRTETITSILTIPNDIRRKIDAVFGKRSEFDIFEALIVVIYRSTARDVSFILCSLYVGTLVARETTAHTCQGVLVKFSTAAALLLCILIVGALTIASKCYVTSNGSHENLLLVKLQYPQGKPQQISFSTKPFSIRQGIKVADLIIRLNSSSRLVLGSSNNRNSSGVQSDTSLILNKHNHLDSKGFTAIFHRRRHHHSDNRKKKTEDFRNFRRKREYLTAFDNVLDFYREGTPHLTTPSTSDDYSDDSSVDNIEINNSNNKINNSNSLQTIDSSENSERNSKKSKFVNRTHVDGLSTSKNVVEIVEDDRQDVTYGFPSASDVPASPSVRKNFQFESSTQRSMPPVNVSENSLSDSGVLVLVVSVVVLTVTLGLVTCVLSHYRGGTAANSHDAAQTPTTAPMLSVVSAGAAAGVGGMDRLRSRGTARELAAARDRQVRVHAVHTDIAINLPPSIALPDGEDHPFNSRLQIRDAEQEAEIYQKCIKPPPNRTVLESESPPPYRSSSAGLLGSISGGSSSSSADWSSSAGSGCGNAPLVVRCHSMSSTSKRHHHHQHHHHHHQQQQENSTGSCGTTCSAMSASTPAAPATLGGMTSGGCLSAAGQKTDFIQRTVKRFTGSKERKGQVLPGANLAISSNNMPVVIVPTKPRRISEQHQQPQQNSTSSTSTTTTSITTITTGSPKPNV